MAKGLRPHVRAAPVEPAGAVVWEGGEEGRLPARPAGGSAS